MLKTNSFQTIDVNKDVLKKTIKPINDKLFGGQYSPLLLPSMEGFKNSVELNDDLVQLREGNAVVQAKDHTTTDITIVERTIEFWDRKVFMEQIIPENADKKQAVIYFHGGSFYGGQIEDVHPMLMDLAEQSNRQVFNVDYSLAPEKAYPNGILDGVAVALYLQDQLDLTDVILSGDSAGGNVVLAVDYLLDKLGFRKSIAHVLLYPVVTLADDDTTALWDLNDYPIKTDQSDIRDNYQNLFHKLNSVMRKYYLQNGEDPSAPLISPLHAQDFKNPDTMIIVGEYDFFRIQNEYYARKLINDGTNVKFIQYNGMAHAFSPKVGMLPQSDDSVTEMAKFIKNL